MQSSVVPAAVEVEGIIHIFGTEPYLLISNDVVVWQRFFKAQHLLLVMLAPNTYPQNQ